jgi:hypothetical protein
MRETRTDHAITCVVLILSAIVTVILLSIAFSAFAGGKHHDHYPVYVPQTTSTAVTDTFNTYNTYEVDKCQGIEEGQAAAAAPVYMGTDSPQMAFGAGECGGDWAGSIRGGLRIQKNLMINGNWTFSEDVNAFGIGGTVVFK